MPYGAVNEHMSKKSDSTTFILSDIHHPFQDQSLLDAVEECMRDAKPDCIILNGDIIDCHAISRFVKAIDATDLSFKHEIDVTEAFIARLRKDHPKATIAYVEGNHEFRIKKLMTEPAQKERWDWLQYYAMLPIILNFEKHKIVYADGGNIGEAKVQLGDVKIGHWGVARSKSGQTASSLIDRYGQKTVQGHTHHASIVYKRFGFGTVWGVENPCMCEINDVEYCMDPNWFQGFTVLREHKNVMHPQLVVVEQSTRSFVFDGEVYEIKDKKTERKFKTLEISAK